MKRIMILALAPLIALALAGAAMIGVTLAITGGGGDAVSPGDIGIAETEKTSERFTVTENNCWSRTTHLSREDAEPLAGWSTGIRLCNFEGAITVITKTHGVSERFSVDENDCWSRTTATRLGLIADLGVHHSAALAEMPGGWWDARLTESIRFCNFEGDITVTVDESGSSQWIPNVLPPDAIAA